MSCRSRGSQTGRDGQAAMSSDPRAAERRKRKGRPRRAEAGSEASRVQPIGGLFASSGQINEQSGFFAIMAIMAISSRRCCNASVVWLRPIDPGYFFNPLGEGTHQ